MYKNASLWPFLYMRPCCNPGAMNKIALPGQFLYMTLQMKLSRSGGASKKLDYFDVLALVVRGLGCVISGRSRVWLEECMNWAKEVGWLFRLVPFDVADG